MTDVIEVSVRRPLRRPGYKVGDICIYTLMALRDDLRVPASTTLVVHDRDGVTAALGPK
jgi:hypothetical protein